MANGPDSPGKLHSPVARLTERTSTIKARPPVAQKPVRMLTLKSEKATAHAIKIQRVLLYRDEAVILEMRNRVTAAALRDETLLEKLKRVILGRRLLSGSSTFDGLTGVDEFVLKPAAKWTLAAEVGAEVELKWNLSSDKSLDNIIHMLFSAMPLVGLGDLVQRVKLQDCSTPAAELVYPGMPVNTLGILVDSSDIGLNEILLHDKRHSVRLQLDKEHRLNQIAHSLEKRPIYVLGLVHNISEALSIQIGTIAAGHLNDIDFSANRV